MSNTIYATEESECSASSRGIPNPIPCKYSSRHPNALRDIWCWHYDRCLDLAVEKDWDSFTCYECQAYTPAKMTAAQIQEDADRCKALIYSLFKKRVASKHLHRLLDHFEAERDENHLWFIDTTCF